MHESGNAASAVTRVSSNTGGATCGSDFKYSATLVLSAVSANAGEHVARNKAIPAQRTLML
jgi:hypothetical protein